MDFDAFNPTCLDKTLKVRGIKIMLVAAHEAIEGVQIRLLSVNNEKFSIVLAKIRKTIKSFKKPGKTILLLNENIHQDKKLPPTKVGNNSTIIPPAIFISLSRREYILSLFTRPTLVRNLRRQV